MQHCGDARPRFGRLCEHSPYAVRHFAARSAPPDVHCKFRARAARRWTARLPRLLLAAAAPCPVRRHTFVGCASARMALEDGTYLTDERVRSRWRNRRAAGGACADECAVAAVRWAAALARRAGRCAVLLRHGGLVHRQEGASCVDALRHCALTHACPFSRFRARFARRAPRTRTRTAGRCICAARTART